MDFKIDIGYDDAERITREVLVDSYATAVEWSDNPKILKHLRKVIEYFSTSTQFKEFEERFPA